MASVLCGATLLNSDRTCTCLAWFVRTDGTLSCGRHKKTAPLKRDVVSECSICLCDCFETDCYTTSCNHHFHKKCLTKWFKKGVAKGGTTCPLCRTSIADFVPPVVKRRRASRPEEINSIIDELRSSNTNGSMLPVLLNQLMASSTNGNFDPDMMERITALLRTT